MIRSRLLCQKELPKISRGPCPNDHLCVSHYNLDEQSIFVVLFSFESCILRKGKMNVSWRRWVIVFIVYMAIIFPVIRADTSQLPTCQMKDFHYTFTECDSSGARWRVQVPKDPDTCTGGAPHPPDRAPDCGFSCDAGEYLAVDEDQKCHKCPPGTYSMGGGIRYEDWTELPEGFSMLSETIDSWMDTQSNCNESSWHLRGQYIASAGDDCATMLVYTANLKKAGSVIFTYQYSDDNTIFHVYAQNDQCQTRKDSKTNRWPTTTAEGEWKTITMSLTSGLNVIYWKTMGIDFEDAGQKKKKLKPVLIKSIEIMGLAYTSECTKCSPGDYAREQGSHFCSTCEANKFSHAGSAECTDCTDTQYSGPGSGNCTERKPCTAKDYFSINTACDENKKTQLTYKWIEPKICRSDVEGAAQLPKAGEKQDCPPCNPGMSFFNNSVCQFCPENQFSDGDKACQTCPGSTAPVYGMDFKWWHAMPPNMDSSCLSMSDYGCVSEQGWTPNGENIHSGQGNDDDAYLILSLHTDGFRSTSGVFNGRPGTVGQVTFVFELVCSGNCGFYFMEEDSRESEVIESWEGNTEKMHFSYDVTKSGPRTFSWAFEKTADEEDFERRDANRYNSDMAKIYTINVTNTIDGGASSCKPCPRGSDVKGCIPCPAGHYIDDQNRCISCPEGTYIHANNPFGKEACLPCGPGTISKDGVLCYSDCHFKSDDGQRIHDFSAHKGFHSVLSSPSFTAKGTRYFHLFNISLCGNEGKGESLCKDNVTYYSENSEDNVTSMLCRATIIPSDDGAPMSAQPVSLGDHLLAVTEATQYNNITVVGFEQKEKPAIPDVNFYYNSETSTTACPNGRASVISLRCDITAPDDGILDLPVGCPDGTCDGCTFHFLWRSQHSCPLCTENDYKSIEENCYHGDQTIHYVWKEPKNCRDGVTLPDNIVKKCPVVTFEAQIAITVAAGCAVLLIALIIYFWKKTRKLEYKYQRLVQSSSSKDGELPTVDSCAVEDGDEDEVIFNDGKEKSVGFFSKFKSKVHKEPLDFEKKTLKELEEDDPLAMFE